MLRMAEMDSLRRRYDESKQADVARNSLIDDLLQQLDDMQKTMDRDAFVMVLIDGDCMNFLNELIKRGAPGGDEAAKLLRRAVFDYLRYDEHFKHDHKIIVRVYANLRGLGKTYVDKGILATASTFADFVLGFNKAHPLCDFIDAGNHKEAADTKLKENISLNIYNVHCKQIIFGASADNGYASFLSSSFVDTDVPTRLRLLQGPPFSSEFKLVLPKFRWTEFKNVFRSEAIADEPEPHGGWYKIPVSAAHRSPMNGSRVTGLDRDHGVLATQQELPSPDDSETDHAIEVSDPKSEHSNESLTSFTQTLTRPAFKTNGTPMAAEITAALVSCTFDRLRVSPKALDFGTVKQMVEQKLGLTSDTWENGEEQGGFLNSKNVIKYAVEQWVEQTNLPPPKNATWMLRYFSNAVSPASIMKDPSSIVWRTRLEQGSLPSGIQKTTPQASHSIYRNKAGQRIDMPKELHAHPSVLHELRYRKPRLCNAHHINRSCFDLTCTYDHQTLVTGEQRNALTYFARSQRCPQGSACRYDKCIKGHMCPNGTHCPHGSTCWFFQLHGIDTEIASLS